METAYFRYATKTGADPQRIFNIAQTIVLTISVILSLLFIVFSASIANLLHIPDKSHYIILLAIIMFIDAAAAIPFAKLRLERRAKQFAFAKIINVIILVGLNLYFFFLFSKIYKKVSYEG